MIYLKMALQSVLRHTHRTVPTITVITLACFVMILNSTLMEGLVKSTEINALSMEIGHVQIHKKGYVENHDMYDSLSGNVTEKIFTILDGKNLNYTPRLYGFALAATDKTSAGVSIRGINVEKEKTVTLIHNHLFKGTWLSTDDFNKVVLGRKLAKALDVTIGDEVVIVGQALDGSMANELFIVTGILKAVSEMIDRGGFYITDETFRNLFAMDPNTLSTHEIAISIPAQLHGGDNQDPAVIVESLNKELPGESDAVSWRELHPSLARFLDIAYVSNYFVIGITYIAIAMVIMNTMTMSILRRIKEFGVMKALGVGPYGVAVTLFTEAMLQIFIATTVAFMLAMPLALRFQTRGLDLTRFISESTIAGIAINPIWTSVVNFKTVATPIILLYVITIVAVIYPTLKAALIKPIKAIYDK